MELLTTSSNIKLLVDTLKGGKKQEIELSTVEIEQLSILSLPLDST